MSNDYIIRKLKELQKSIDFTIEKVEEKDIEFAVEDINETIYCLAKIREDIVRL